jgi:hypothetical protein
MTNHAGSSRSHAEQGEDFVRGFRGIRPSEVDIQEYDWVTPRWPIVGVHHHRSEVCSESEAEKNGPCISEYTTPGWLSCDKPRPVSQKAGNIYIYIYIFTCTKLHVTDGLYGVISGLPAVWWFCTPALSTAAATAASASCLFIRARAFCSQTWTALGVARSRRAINSLSVVLG